MIELGTIWRAKGPNRQGAVPKDRYVSHWDRWRPHLLVTFAAERDGSYNRNSRTTYHPEVLAEHFDPLPEPPK